MSPKHSPEIEFELSDDELKTSSLNEIVGGAGNKGLFEVDDYSFDIEQVLNIGSQSTGAGAGK